MFPGARGGGGSAEASSSQQSDALQVASKLEAAQVLLSLSSEDALAAKDVFMRSALHFCCAVPAAAMLLPALLERSAQLRGEIDLSDAAGRSPMQHAVRSGNAAAVRTLLELGGAVRASGAADHGLVECVLGAGAAGAEIVEMLVLAGEWGS